MHNFKSLQNNTATPPHHQIISITTIQSSIITLKTIINKFKHNVVGKTHNADFVDKNQTNQNGKQIDINNNNNTINLNLNVNLKISYYIKHSKQLPSQLKLIAKISNQQNPLRYRYLDF
jgi:hypothetical protein